MPMNEELNKELQNEGGTPNDLPSKPGDDINTNLGSFGGDEPSPLVTPNPTIAAQTPIEETAEEKKEHKFKIDFDKFNRRKRRESNNPFNIKVDMWLRTKKSLIIVWLIILAIIVTLLITQIVLPIYGNKAVNQKGNGPWSYSYMHILNEAQKIMSYISLALIPGPFIFLLTTWVVGINAVAKSRVFHYVLWSMLALACILAIVVIAINGYILCETKINPSW